MEWFSCEEYWFATFGWILVAAIDVSLFGAIGIPLTFCLLVLVPLSIVLKQVWEKKSNPQKKVARKYYVPLFWPAVYKIQDRIFGKPKDGIEREPAPFVLVVAIFLIFNISAFTLGYLSNSRGDAMGSIIAYVKSDSLIRDHFGLILKVRLSFKPTSWRDSISIGKNEKGEEDKTYFVNRLIYVKGERNTGTVFVQQIKRNDGAWKRRLVVINDDLSNGPVTILNDWKSED
jgi:hypothetical protein